MVALIVASALALGMIEDPGYVLIGYGQWSVETTLSFLVLAMLMLFVVSYYAVRFLIRLFRMPRAAKEWNIQRRSDEARKGLSRGLIKLSEGDWKGAEKQLLKRIAYSDSPAIHYMAAARAAQKQGAKNRRDNHLSAARESNPNADIAVGITEAELLISQRQLDQALTTLTKLRSLAPRNRHVLEMLMGLYMSLGDWNRLSELLPDLHKRKVITGSDADLLDREVHLELLNQAAQDGEIVNLKDAWGRLPKRLSRDKTLQLAYASHLQDLGAVDDAEVFVRRALKHGWNKPLVNIYGQLESSNSSRQLAGAETWLKEHEKDPELLLSLGRLAMRSQLWGKARGYLETSVGIAPTVEGYQLLANLLEQLDDPVEAAECYRKATILASESALPTLPPTVDTNDSVNDKAALIAPV